MQVYLAGPITGLNYAGSTEWRNAVITALLPAKGLSPMRGKEYLKDVEQFTADGDAYKALSCMSSDRGIMTRDFYDTTRANVVLVNLLGATKPSIGTIMEIAWAFQAKVPVVCAIEPSGNPHEHGMIKEAIGFRVPTLEEAVRVTRAILAI